MTTRPQRCSCQCHRPGAQVMHFMACCTTCPGCYEPRILSTLFHTCPPVHLGVKTPEGVELTCSSKVFCDWVSSKDLPRKIMRVPIPDEASVFFTLKLAKVTCPECHEITTEPVTPVGGSHDTRTSISKAPDPAG